MIIAGNWKMNLNTVSATGLATALDEWSADHPEVEVIIFPPAVLIHPVRACLKKSSTLFLGGQDCHDQGKGAHTGDISAEMLADAGCQWVLVGHSERRQNHGENNDLVAAKASRACAEGLKPMICVGESLSEKETGMALDVVAEQVRQSLPDDGMAGAIAYEPVWSIGTGKTPSPADIADMHAHIRSVLVASHPGGGSIPILYGGSVNKDNAASILILDDVDGALVGGASLTADDFTAIASV